MGTVPADAEQEPAPMEVDEPPAPPVVPAGMEPRQPERFDIGAPAVSELSVSTMEHPEGAVDTAEAETQAAPVPKTRDLLY